jgi:hypothetical protein
MHAEYGIFVYTIWPLFGAAPRREGAHRLGSRARRRMGPQHTRTVSDATHGHRHVVACANACVVGARGWTCVASVHAGRTRGVEVPRAASVRRSERLVKYGLFC